MNREEKQQVIEELKDIFQKTPILYFADTSSLTVAQVNDLRRICFQKGVTMKVAKNTLIMKALEANDQVFDGADTALKGQTALFISDVGNLPARIIRDFRKGNEKPALKAAYIDSAVFLGDEQLENLTQLKSKEELVGEIIGLLQSPARNVISALQSGGQKLSGIVKTLSERA